MCLSRYADGKTSPDLSRLPRLAVGRAVDHLIPLC
jgi:hypothetical protein